MSTDVKYCKAWEQKYRTPLRAMANLFWNNLLLHSSSQSALTILVLKTWVGLWIWKRYGVKKQGQDFFLLFRKGRSSVASSLLNCKLQANSDPEKIGLMQLYIFLKFQTLKQYQVDLMNWISGWRLTGQLGFYKTCLNNDLSRFTGVPNVRVETLQKPATQQLD